MLNGDCGDKREECIATGGVMEDGVAGIAEALVCSGSVIRLVGWISWRHGATKATTSSLITQRYFWNSCI